MKKLISATLIALGLLSGTAMAEGNWTLLERIAPDGLEWDVYVDADRTDVSEHKGWFKMVQISGEPSGYYSIETLVKADCRNERLKNTVLQPYQNFGKEKGDTPDGKYSQPWHPANKEHTEGVILKHLCQ